MPTVPHAAAHAMQAPSRWPAFPVPVPTPRVHQHRGRNVLPVSAVHPGIRGVTLLGPMGGRRGEGHLPPLHRARRCFDCYPFAGGGCNAFLCPVWGTRRCPAPNLGPIGPPLPLGSSRWWARDEPRIRHAQLASLPPVPVP